jgi:PcfJ-like protein
MGVVELHSSGYSDVVKKFYEIYSTDRLGARVYYYNNKLTNGNSKFMVFTIKAFEFDNGDFDIVSFRNTYGINKNNITYKSQARLWTIYYRGSKKSFHLKKGSSIQQLSLYSLHSFLQNSSGTETSYNISEIGDNIIYKYMSKKLSWLLFLPSNYITQTLSFSCILRHRLYDLKSIYRYYFKVPYKVALIVENNFQRVGSTRKLLTIWDEMLKILNKPENLTAEFITNKYFFDTCRLAGMLNTRINCSWSLKRLALEHDKFSKLVVENILKYEEYRELNIANIFKRFQKFSNFKMLTSNFDLIEEGRRLSHCVGTYSSNVDNGSGCVYQVYGYTLYLVVDDEQQRLSISQYYGYKNENVPSDIYQRVVEVVAEFNKSIHGLPFNYSPAINDSFPF